MQHFPYIFHKLLKVIAINLEAQTNFILRISITRSNHPTFDKSRSRMNEHLTHSTCSNVKHYKENIIRKTTTGKLHVSKTIEL